MTRTFEKWTLQANDGLPSHAEVVIREESCMILGSGFSMEVAPTGLNWSALIRRVGEAFLPDEANKLPEDLHAAAVVLARRGERTRGIYPTNLQRTTAAVIQHAWERKVRNLKRTNIQGFASFLNKANIRLIVDLNYDEAAERALEAAGQPYTRLIGPVESVPYSRETGVILWKIHGDYRHPSTITLSPYEYYRLYREQGAMAILRNMMVRFPKVFGFGLGLSDEDIYSYICGPETKGDLFFVYSYEDEPGYPDGPGGARNTEASGKFSRWQEQCQSGEGSLRFIDVARNATPLLIATNGARSVFDHLSDRLHNDEYREPASLGPDDHVGLLRWLLGSGSERQLENGKVLFVDDWLDFESPTIDDVEFSIRTLLERVATLGVPHAASETFRGAVQDALNHVSTWAYNSGFSVRPEMNTKAPKAVSMEMGSGPAGAFWIGEYAPPALLGIDRWSRLRQWKVSRNLRIDFESGEAKRDDGNLITDLRESEWEAAVGTFWRTRCVALDVFPLEQAKGKPLRRIDGAAWKNARPYVTPIYPWGFGAFVLPHFRKWYPGIKLTRKWWPVLDDSLSKIRLKGGSVRDGNDFFRLSFRGKLGFGEYERYLATNDETARSNGD